MNEVILYFLVFSCILLDAIWYKVIKQQTHQIYSTLACLISAEYCVNTINASITIGGQIGSFVVIAIFCVLIISAFVLGNVCDQMSDTSVRSARKGEFVEELESKRHRFTIASALWMVFLMGTISFYTLIIISNDKAQQLFANSTIIISLGLLFVIIRSYCHNEANVYIYTEKTQRQSNDCHRLLISTESPFN